MHPIVGWLLGAAAVVGRAALGLGKAAARRGGDIAGWVGGRLVSAPKHKAGGGAPGGGGAGRAPGGSPGGGGARGAPGGKGVEKKPGLLQRGLGSITSFASLLWLLDMLDNSLKRAVPNFKEVIKVKVYGDSSSVTTMKELQRLALSVAFGKVAPPVTIGPHILICEYDYMNRIVEVTVGYSYSGVFQQAANLFGLNAKGMDRLIQGPSEAFIGGTWPVFPESIIGFRKRGEELEEQGRSILQREPAPNPGPPFDGFSRADDLVALVTASLSTPCCTPPKPTAQYVYAATMPQVLPNETFHGTFVPGVLTQPGGATPQPPPVDDQNNELNDPTATLG